MRDPEIFYLSGGSSVPVRGLLPLGYQARDRKLVMVEIEVEIAASSAAMPNWARYNCRRMNSKPVVSQASPGPARAGSPVGWQAIRARCALSDAAEPHLST